MFCQKCGAPLQPNERFCTKCGAPNDQPQQPQQQAYQQPQQGYQQPQQGYQQPQQGYQQGYRPQQPYGYRPQTDKRKLFGLLTLILFGAATVFLLVSFIGGAVKKAYGFGEPGGIISYIIAILGCGGIALAPLFKQYTKFFFAACSATLFVGMFGIFAFGLSVSIGYLFLMLGFAALAVLCWLTYTGNKLVKQIWIGAIPAGLLFLGFLLNWIILKLFSVEFKFILVFGLFDFLFGLTIMAAVVFLGLFAGEIFGDKAEKPFANKQPPMQRPQQPPYQGR